MALRKTTPIPIVAEAPADHLVGHPAAADVVVAVVIDTGLSEIVSSFRTPKTASTNRNTVDESRFF